MVKQSENCPICGALVRWIDFSQQFHAGKLAQCNGYMSGARVHPRLVMILDDEETYPVPRPGNESAESDKSHFEGEA